MATVSDPSPEVVRSRRPWSLRRAREMWASLAIGFMWLVVLIDALFGPDMVFSNAGANYTQIPSAVVLVFFAYLGTRVVARFGLGDRPQDPDSV